jgi:dihydroorotate dehydrogenase (fumarate)/dihydroorotate dehydrogenase
VGVNLVETNTGRPATPDDVLDQFVRAARPFCGVADYLALNLNCPNTNAGESVLTDPSRLGQLLAALGSLDRLPTVFLKVTATDDPARIEVTLRAVEPFCFVAGFSFNVPPGKPYKLRTPRAVLARMPGAVCGRPTQALIRAATRAWFRRLDPRRHALIAAGGVFAVEDAYELIRLGASFVQMYVALVYRGPGVVREITAGLANLLGRDGFRSVAEAMGTAR